jgi:hypothetical protein
MVKKASQGYFLLVASRQLIHGLPGMPAAYLNRFDEPSCHLILLRGPNDRTRPKPFEFGKRQVVRNRKGKRQAFTAPIFAQEAYSLAKPLGRRRGAFESPNADLSLPNRVEAEDSTDHFGPSRSYESGNTEYFPSMKRQARLLGFAHTGQAIEIE